MTSEQNRTQPSQRWVIKIGSALITADNTGLNLDNIRHWCSQFARLMNNGVELILVSSGSIAEGIHRLNWHSRPKEIYKLQAAAAVGQMGLVQTYESELKSHGISAAQILLTHEDLSDRTRYLNARTTLTTLLTLSVLPVVNENDTVTTDEIRFGDNDNLAALVADLVQAQKLVILTDQHGLFDKDPRAHSDATLVGHANANDPALLSMAGPSGSTVGSGGMTTKILAAQRASRAGTDTIIANGRETDVLLRLYAGESIGTHLEAAKPTLDARRRWLANQLKVRGNLIVDEGAASHLEAGTASLLAIGITGVDGDFYRGQLVSCRTAGGKEVARGLVNYNAAEIQKIAGCHSNEIKQRLGYIHEPEVINRDVMVSM